MGANALLSSFKTIGGVESGLEALRGFKSSNGVLSHPNASVVIMGVFKSVTLLRAKFATFADKMHNESKL